MREQSEEDDYNALADERAWVGLTYVVRVRKRKAMAKMVAMD